MQLPPLLRPAVVLGIACYPRSRASGVWCVLLSLWGAVSWVWLRV